MDINITLIGQMITFSLFVWFTMKFVWPPINDAMQERQRKIADGLAAAERGEQSLKEAEHKMEMMLKEARTKASDIVDQANKRASTIVDESKEIARVEGKRILEAAQAEIAQEQNKARDALRNEVITLAMTAAQKVLERSVDEKMHREMLNKLAAEI